MHAEVRRFALEDKLDALIASAKIVQRPGDDRLAAIDDRHVIGDLFDFRELMRREEHRG